MNDNLIDIPNYLDHLRRLDQRMFRRDFLLTWHKTDRELEAVITLAEILRALYRSNISCRVFETGLAVSFFRDKSTRTRLAYASACDLIGLTVQEMEEEKSQISHGETVRETANMISFLSEVIGIRDDLFLGRGHRFMSEVADALTGGFEEGVLNHRPAVINLQCDLDHPTQTLSDLFHLRKYFGGLENLRGKKLAMSWAYSPSYGKPLSVPQGIIALMSRYGMEITLAHPPGYELVEDIIKLTGENSERSGGSFSVTDDMKKAFQEADVVYPKSWAPARVAAQRTELAGKNDVQGLKELEKEALAENAKYKNWLCDEKLMKSTRNGEALYLHCLPADVQGLNCAQGEVTMGVFDKYRIETYREARYKAFVIAAMIVLCRFRDPARLIERIFRDRNHRAG